jgi:mRNA interferase MazF
MTNFQPGELVLVTFPFTGPAGSKVRPALVVWDSGDEDVVLARVTTQVHRSQLDIPISEWKQAGLLAPSIARLHKLATIDKKMVGRRLGKLAAPDRTNVGRALEQYSRGW